jgi:hypothetical protein
VDEAVALLEEGQLIDDSVLPAVQLMLHERTIPIKKLLTVVDLAR